MQRTLFRSQPENYANLSLLTAYMLQSTLFAPPVVVPELRLTLAKLSYGVIVKRYGMLFLRSMVPTLPRPLDEVCSDDSPPVIAALGGEVPKRFRPSTVLSTMISPAPSVEHPLGSTPTMKDINLVLKGDPLSIAKEHEISPVVDHILGG